MSRSQAGFPAPVRKFWILNVALVVLCVIWIALNVYVRHRGYPYNTPFLQFDHFIDFYDFRVRFTHYHQLDFFSTDGKRGSIFSYPPPAGLLYAFFYLPKDHAHALFTAVTLPPLFVFAWLFWRSLIRRAVQPILAGVFVASCCLLSFPYWYEYMLGNMELCLFIMIAAALILMLRGYGYIAAVIIGIAGSMKLFPFILLGLFLSRRQYRQMFVGFLSAAILYPIALWMECPSLPIAIRGMRTGAGAISKGLVLQWHQAETAFDHSIFGIFKQTMHLLGYSNTQPPGRVTVYMAIAAFTGIVLYFWKIRRLPLMNQILALIIAAILLPPMSSDYTLLHLYTPWAFLVLVAVEAARERRNIPGLTAMFVCFAVLFAPESELIIRGAAFAGQLKAVTLIVLWYLAMRYPLPLPGGLHKNEVVTVSEMA